MISRIGAAQIKLAVGPLATQDEFHRPCDGLLQYQRIRVNRLGPTAHGHQPWHDERGVPSIVPPIVVFL
jgi:hypothetical protein